MKPERRGKATHIGPRGPWGKVGLSSVSTGKPLESCKWARTWSSLPRQTKTLCGKWMSKEAGQYWKHGSRLGNWNSSGYHSSWPRLELLVAWTRLTGSACGKVEAEQCGSERKRAVGEAVSAADLSSWVVPHGDEGRPGEEQVLKRGRGFCRAWKV